MKIIQIKKILIVLVCLLPGVVMAQSKFVIHGKVTNSNSPIEVYLTYRSGIVEVIDSAALKNGVFNFTGIVNEITPAIIRMRHDSAPVHFYDRSAVDKINFYLEPGAMLDIFTAKDSISYASVKGSKVNSDNGKYKFLIKDVIKKRVALKAEWDSKTEIEHKDKTFRENINARYNEAERELNAINKAFIEGNRNSYISLVVFKNGFKTIDLTNVNAVDDEFRKFPIELQETSMGKYISYKIASVKKTQKSEITTAKPQEAGDMAPDFTLQDINGKAVKLSDFRGKYVLLDFWASWCRPCRAKNPDIVAAYKKFKDKNFTILGVSSDRNSESGKAAWLNAIQTDGLTWTQLIEDSEQSAGKLYDVRFIPTNFLIDVNGKIIGHHMYGNDLKNKLSEVLNSRYSASSDP